MWRSARFCPVPTRVPDEVPVGLGSRTAVRLVASAKRSKLVGGARQVVRAPAAANALQCGPRPSWVASALSSVASFGLAR